MRADLDLRMMKTPFNMKRLRAVVFLICLQYKPFCVQKKVLFKHFAKFCSIDKAEQMFDGGFLVVLHKRGAL